MRVEIEETKHIGSGATLHVLDGVALASEMFQDSGLTFSFTFSSKEQAETFVLVFTDYYNGTCEVSGRLVTIKGRE